jgi:hypothetical protein
MMLCEIMVTVHQYIAARLGLQVILNLAAGAYNSPQSAVVLTVLPTYKSNLKLPFIIS